MFKLLVPLFLLLSSAAAPLGATNITVHSGREDSADRLQVLRGMAEVMIRESQERITVGEGEELVIRTGGKSEKTEIDPAAEARKWQEQLSTLGSTMNLDELPSTIHALRQSQDEANKQLQDTFKALSAAAGVSADERQTFLRNLERQIGVVLEDQAILGAMRLKVESALASASSSQRVQLAGYLKEISASISYLQSRQAEASKMARTDFKIQDDTGSREADSKQVNALLLQASEAAAPVESIEKELSAKPGSLSQDYFKEAQETAIRTLGELDKLTQEAQAVLDRNPANTAALALLKHLSDKRTQISVMMRGLAVVEVPHAVLTRLQELDDTVSHGVRLLLERVAELKKGTLTKEQLAELFASYDRLAEQYGEGQKLREDAAKSAAGQKYRTSEQTELEAMAQRLNDAFQGLGAAASQLADPGRDQLWADYLLAPAQIELVDDVTSEKIKETAVPPHYLPLTRPTSRDDAASLLSGAILGDVLLKDGISYGVALRVTGPDAQLPAGPGAPALNRAQLEVFRIENGQYSSVDLGAFSVYDGPAQAALRINAEGKLVVYLTHTMTGNELMDGSMHELDSVTLSQLDTVVWSFGDKRGWYPRFNDSGVLEHVYVDGVGNEHRCENNDACAEPFLPGAEFLQASDNAKSLHSGNTFDTAAFPDELPAAVVGARLSGETEAEWLGGYSHLSWGRWNDGPGAADSIYVDSPWIAGSLTPTAAIPVTGSASYNGKVLGKLNEGGGIYGVGGTAALTANFSNATLTGTFSMTKNDAAWKTAAVNAAWTSGAGNISGSLSTTDALMSGAVKGNFFGPGAEQVGGSWNLNNLSTGDRAAGVFAADKQ